MKVDVYYPVMDTGREQRLEILGTDGSAVWTADLVEDGDPLDADAHKHRDSVPTWHGASGDGDVQGQVINLILSLQGDCSHHCSLFMVCICLSLSISFCFDTQGLQPTTERKR
jgi:hypothetical protein